MNLWFDEDTGRVAIDFGGDPATGWVRLRRPRLRQWADWSEHAAALARRTASALQTAGDEGELAEIHEAVILAGPQAALNWEMIYTLAGVILPARLPDDHPLQLTLADAKLTERLLSFWWACPLAPWDTGVPADEQDLSLAPQTNGRRRSGKDDDRKIGTQLPGTLGVLSVIYQALLTVGMGAGFEPRNVGEWEIWEVAMALGRDGPAGEAMAQGGEMRRRGDGQVDTMGFGRDPDQPRFFGPNADPKKAWDYLMRGRRVRKQRAERDAARGRGETVTPAPRRRRRGGPWRP